MLDIFRTQHVKNTWLEHFGCLHHGTCVAGTEIFSASFFSFKYKKDGTKRPSFPTFVFFHFTWCWVCFSAFCCFCAGLWSAERILFLRGLDLHLFSLFSKGKLFANVKSSFPGTELQVKRTRTMLTAASRGNWLIYRTVWTKRRQSPSPMSEFRPKKSLETTFQKSRHRSRSVKMQPNLSNYTPWVPNSHCHQGSFGTKWFWSPSFMYAAQCFFSWHNSIFASLVCMSLCRHPPLTFELCPMLFRASSRCGHFPPFVHLVDAFCNLGFPGCHSGLRSRTLRKGWPHATKQSCFQVALWGCLVTEAPDNSYFAQWDDHQVFLSAWMREIIYTFGDSHAMARAAKRLCN